MDQTFSTTPQTKETIEALWRLQRIILDTLDFNQVVEKIVNGLLDELGYLKLGYRIIVLTLVDPDRGVLKRISLSQTEEAERALAASAVPFHQIEIPLTSQDNLLIKVLQSQKPAITTSWFELFTPILTTEEALSNQTAAGIKTSMLYPVIVKNNTIGVLIFSLVKEEAEVTQEERDLINGFTEIVGLAVQNSKLYSELAKSTEELKNANDKLLELDKKKDEFVSLASHELRTPMTAIRSYLWLALAGKGGDLNEKQTYYLERSYNSTVRLIQLVNDMLNVSRIESGRITLNVQKVDLGKFTDEVVGEVKPRADELGIVLENHYDPGNPMPPVLADPDKIKEVLINFIGNSLKFSPKGSKISISFEVKDQMVLIHVADSGEGIAPEDMDKLFQKFSLIKESYVTNQKAAQGTGLGLYISKSIVELHGGRIWAESPGHGQGATFSFSLKIYNDDDFKRIEESNSGKEGLGIIPNVV